MFKAVLEVLMAENTGMTEFRDVTPSRLLDGYERLVEKCFLLLQCVPGRRRHPLSTLQATTASSEASFVSKSSLLPFS
jgi:hypothetical protein